jgi:hypothetical protein
MRVATNAAALLASHPFLFLPFVLYRWTVAPTIGMSDTAILVDAMYRLNLSTAANNHNLTILAGWVMTHLPLGELAFRANLTSVILGSLAVAGFYVLIVETLGSRLTAAFSAACLGVSQSMWWHSTIVECYAMNSLFVVTALGLLVRLDRTGDGRWLRLLFFLSGLALFNHVQMGILGLGALVVLAHWLRRPPAGAGARWRWRQAGGCLGMGLVGAAPYLLTFGHDVARAGGDFGTTLHEALGGGFTGLMFAGSPGKGLGDVLFLLALQFPSPYLALVAVGSLSLARRWKGRPARWALLTMLGVNTVFFALYDTWDRFAFLLPSFVILAFAGAFGVDSARRALARRTDATRTAIGLGVVITSLGAPPFVYARVSRWAQEDGFWKRRYDNTGLVNTHDGTAYVVNPDKRRFRDVERYTDLLFDALPAGAIYIDDDSRHYYAITMYYRKYYGRRPDLDVRLINMWGMEGWGLSRPDLALLLARAYDEDRDLFVVTVDQPVGGMLEGLPALFRRFPLDADHWIYKLITRREIESLFAHLPRDLPRFGPLTVRPTGEKGSATLRAELAFEEPSRFPFPIAFDWIGPDGTVRATTGPVVVAPRSASMSASQAIPDDGHAEAWRVRARVGGLVVQSSVGAEGLP